MTGIRIIIKISQKQIYEVYPHSEQKSETSLKILRVNEDDSEI